MSETEKTTTKYEGIQIDVHPGHNGESVERDLRIKGTEKKLELSLAIPRDDKEAQALYNCDLATIISKGVKQVSYDRDNFLRDGFTNGTFTVENAANVVGPAFAKELASAVVKTERKMTPETKAKMAAARAANKAKVTAADALESKLGVSVAEMANMTQAQLADLAKKLAKSGK